MVVKSILFQYGNERESDLPMSIFHLLKKVSSLKNFLLIIHFLKSSGFKLKYVFEKPNVQLRE